MPTGREQPATAFGAPHTLLVDVRDRAERLCREVAPEELSGRNLYALLSSEIVGWPMPSNSAGLVDWSNGMSYRDEIGRRWQGSGYAFIIDRFRTMQIARHRQLACGSTDFGYAVRSTFYEIALHELAHILVNQRGSGRRLVAPSQPSQESAQQLRAVVAQAMSADLRQVTGLVPWAGHDVGFIRAVCHLATRARKRGANVWLETMCAGPRYGLSSGQLYAAGFAKELAATNSRAVVEWLAEPLPQAVDTLWANDIARHHLASAAYVMQPAEGQST